MVRRGEELLAFKKGRSRTVEGSFEFDRRALSPACSQLLDNPPRHDILLDPCSRCTVFVNTACASPKLGVASSQAHGFYCFYSSLMMALCVPCWQ